MRQTPWINTAELQHIHGIIYAQPPVLGASRFALDRLEAWLSRPCCSSNIECTAALLAAVLSEQDVPKPSPRGLKDRYALALIRFVNSVVDPMQVHFYARSIASIATQLGLPVWFVELRHAATHETLPALPVLRSAAHLALGWLNDRYWTPLLSAGSPQSPRELEYLQQEMNDELRKFKVDRKDALRDVTKYKAQEISKVCKNLDRIVNAYAISLNRDDVEASTGIEALVEILLIPGGLVPASKKKRKSDRWQLPTELAQIWDPLLSFFDEKYSMFSRILLSRIVGILLKPIEELQSYQDSLYLDTLCNWLAHLIERFAIEDLDLQQQLLSVCLTCESPRLIALVNMMSQSTKTAAPLRQPLQALVPLALAERQQQGAQIESNGNFERRLTDAETRWSQLLQQSTSGGKTNQRQTGQPISKPWRIARPAEFERSPIGMLGGNQDYASLALAPLQPSGTEC